MNVFLSSTSRDLKAHREAAFEAIQGLGMHCIRMEDFHGPAEKIEDFDAKQLGVCDLVIILLGHLHGSCPSGSKKSYTELEYEAAIESGKPCILFLADEDLPLPARLIEKPIKQARQQGFRRRAAEGVIRDTFSSPEDLAKRIVQAIHKWRESTLRSSPTTFLPLPPQPNLARPYALQENFVGRVTERRELSQWLLAGHNILSMVALGGMGKSALAWAWLQRDVLGIPLPGIADTKDEQCRVPSNARPDGILWWSFYENEASFITFVRESLYYASDGQRDAMAVPNIFDQVKIMTALLAQRRLLFVLDGFERELQAYAGLNAAYQGDAFRIDEHLDARSCISPYARDFVRWIAATPMRSRVLITSRLDFKELDNLAGCRRMDLGVLTRDDASHFFRTQAIRGTQAEIQDVCAS